MKSFLVSILSIFILVVPSVLIAGTKYRSVDENCRLINNRVICDKRIQRYHNPYDYIGRNRIHYERVRFNHGNHGFRNNVYSSFGRYNRQQIIIIIPNNHYRYKDRHYYRYKDRHRKWNHNR